MQSDKSIWRSAKLFSRFTNQHVSNGLLRQAVLLFRADMATIRLMFLYTGKGRTVEQGSRVIINHTENPQKANGVRLITSWQCGGKIADDAFLFTKNQYIQRTGRVRGEDDAIAYPPRHSFVPGEITLKEASRLGWPSVLPMAINRLHPYRQSPYLVCKYREYRM